MRKRTLPLALLAAISLLILGLVACGSDDSSSTPAAQNTGSSSSALSMTELRDCAEANSGKRSSSVLMTSEDEQTRYEDRLGAAAPDDVVRQVLRTGGGWLRLTYKPDDSRIVVIASRMDVLDFRTSKAAETAKQAVLAGMNEDGEPVSKFSQAVQVENLVFVYERDSAYPVGSKWGQAALWVIWS